MHWLVLFQDEQPDVQDYMKIFISWALAVFFPGNTHLHIQLLSFIYIGALTSNHFASPPLPLPPPFSPLHIPVLFLGLHQCHLGFFWEGLQYFFTYNWCLIGWVLDFFDGRVLLQRYLVISTSTLTLASTITITTAYPLYSSGITGKKEEIFKRKKEHIWF